MSAQEAILVVTDAYYPGWKATIDGLPTQVWRANYALRAVVVPAGEHEVRYIYDPLSLRLGVGISTASISLLLILVLFVCKSKKLNILF